MSATQVRQRGTEQEGVDSANDSDSDGLVSRSMVAGLLLLARPYLRRHGMAAPGVADILRATGAGQTRAYACRKQLRRILARSTRPVGRPVATAAARAPSIEARILRFLMNHPGAVTTGRSRRHYSDGFRRFIVKLRADHPDVDRSAFARAAQVPLPTLKQWERLPSATPAVPEAESDHASNHVANHQSNHQANNPPDDPIPAIAIPRLITAWRQWRGSFSAFCSFVREELGMDCGRTWIGDVLDAAGERPRRSRVRRPPDHQATRESFATFFPGAQWAGDGTALTVAINGKRFRFNLELIVDTHTAALVGASVSDEEDSDAVVAAVDDARTTTGKPSLALLLDRRSCNRSRRVASAMSDTLLLHATRGRPQNKAHVEGAFGLFAQTMPPLEISAETPRQLARRIVELTVQAWARTLNHRSQSTRGGASRVQRYRRGQATRRRRRARRLLRKRAVAHCGPRSSSPAASVLTWIQAAYQRLGVVDPTGRIARAMARYPIDAILGGVATYEGKRDAGTLPDNISEHPGSCGARYLLGLVRTVANFDEGVAISRALWGTRRLMRGEIIDRLARRHAAILASPETRSAALARLVDHAIAADLRLERLYWLEAAGQEIRRASRSASSRLFEQAARRILASHTVPRPVRLQAIRILASQALPVA